MNSTPLFLLLTLGSASAFAVGNILQKIGLRATGAHASLRTPLLFLRGLLSNLPWWLGLGLSAVASLGYYGAMALFNISLVQPLMALNPMLTALLGWLFLRERMSRRIALAIAFVFLGLLCAGLQAGEAPGRQDESALWLFAALSALLGLFAYKLLSGQEAKDALLSGWGFGISAIFYKSLALDAPDLAALPLTSSLPWLLDFRSLAFLSTYGLGFLYAQIGLSRGRALIIIPFSAALGTLLTTLSGAVVYAEPFPPLKMAGMALVVIGTVLFAEKKNPSLTVNP